MATLVDEYVDSRRWDTLVGRAWCMQTDTSRAEFKEFLTKQLSQFFQFVDTKEKDS